jgi:hypothetical protein
MPSEPNQMKFSRANDRVGPETLAVRPVPEELQGTWFNTSPDTGEIGKIVISVRDGVVSLQVFAVDADDLKPWGESVATPYVDRIGSSSVAGLIADYDLGFVRTRLAANLKYGVLVIQSYNEFCDGSGRPAYFTREFFSREVVHRTEPLAASVECALAADLPPTGMSGGTVDLGHYVGQWTNTNPETNGITHFSFEADGGRYWIRAAGAGQSSDWGCAEVIPHANSVTETDGIGFLARYDLGFVEVTLAANENKGLMIVASYHRFRDASARSSYFKREFFYRQEAVRR